MSAPRSDNVTWHDGVPRAERWAAIGAAGATVWFTGLPSSGKSTVAAALERRLLELGRPAYLLDGDNLRHGINGDLGFDAEARAENVRRTAHIARLLADAGTVALVAAVSPRAADRDGARAIHAADDLTFLEVFVNTPLATCRRRDPKSLYARAKTGEIRGFTGVDAPYEAPLDPDLELGPEQPVAESVDRLLDLIPGARVLTAAGS